VELRERALGHRDGLVLAGPALQQHGELVAAEPCRGVAVAEAAHQPLGHLAEHAVAGLVAQRVVDDLEVVDVDEQHVDRVAAGPQRLVHAVDEERAVRQAGE